MYCEYYGFVRRPFEMTPDPTFLYLGEAHREGLATLIYGVQSGKGFVAAHRRGGNGQDDPAPRAALAARFVDGVGVHLQSAPRAPGLLRHPLQGAGDRQEVPSSKAEYLLALNEFLIERLRNDEPTLLIIDEAQNLSPEMLEEIRLLSNLETPTSKLIQIMLVGQPELNEMLTRPELRQLRQRIALRHHLRPFDAQETRRTTSASASRRRDIRAGGYSSVRRCGRSTRPPAGRPA